MRRNVAGQFVGCQLIAKADGTPITTGTTTVYVTGDAGTQGAGSVGSGACTHEGQGFWTYAPANTETNYTHVAFTFVNTNAINATVQIYPIAYDASGQMTGVTVASGGIAAASFAAGAINAAAIADAAIDAATFAAGAITATVIATGAIDADALAADTITAAKVAADVSTEIAAAVAAPSAATIAAAVWDLDATGHTTQGTFGQAIGDPIADTNSIFKAVVTDATGATVGVDVVDLKTQIGTAGAGLTAADDAVIAAIPSAATVAAAVWDLDATTHQTTGTFGQAIGDPGADTHTIYDAVVTAAAGVNIAADIIAVKAETATIVADTNELQTDWTNGGRLDLILDIIAADTTTDIPGAIAALNDLSATEIEDAVWDAVMANHLDAGSTGAALNGATAPSAATIADAVWDEAIAGHLGVGSTGAALSAAGAAGDPWITPLPGAYIAGQAGYIVGTNLDVPVSDPVTLAASQPATTHASITVTGALTVSDGLIVNAATTNRAGVAIAGNGTAPGVYVAGGSTGDGIRAESGTGGTAKAGISAVGLGTGGIGLKSTGAGTGAGFSSTGGADGAGILAQGGATSGNGLKALAGGGGVGIEAGGTGTDGHGISAHGAGGVSSHGIQSVSGGGLLGHGIHALATATTGSGLSLQGSGGANEDLLLNTPSTNLDDAILARLGTPAGASVSVDIAAVKVDTAAIKLKTDNLPSDPADESALEALINDLPTNAELATAFGTADDAVLAAIAALNNLSQANIRTAIGLGSANLDTQLDALPTNAELATALGTADDAVLAAIAALNNLSAAQVNAEVVDALATDTYAEPTGVPAATASLAAKIGRLHQALRNAVTVTATTKTFKNDAGADLWTKALSDDGSTYTEAEGA